MNRKFRQALKKAYNIPEPVRKNEFLDILESQNKKENKCRDFFSYFPDVLRFMATAATALLCLGVYGIYHDITEINQIPVVQSEINPEETHENQSYETEPYDETNESEDITVPTDESPEIGPPQWNGGSDSYENYSGIFFTGTGTTHTVPKTPDTGKKNENTSKTTAASVHHNLSKTSKTSVTRMTNHRITTNVSVSSESSDVNKVTTLHPSGTVVTEPSNTVTYISGTKATSSVKISVTSVAYVSSAVTIISPVISISYAPTSSVYISVSRENTYASITTVTTTETTTTATTQTRTTEPASSPDPASIPDNKIDYSIPTVMIFESEIKPAAKISVNSLKRTKPFDKPPDRKRYYLYTIRGKTEKILFADSG